MRNLSRSRFVNHISQLGKRNALGTSQRNTERLERLEVALLRVKTQNDVKFFIAFVNGPSRGARKGGFKNAVDFVNSYPISRHAFMVVFYLNLRQSRYLFNEDSAHARHIPDHSGNLISLLGKHIEIVAKDLNRHILLDARKQLVVAHLDRLRNLCLQARNRLQGFFHLLHQFGGSFCRSPLGFRLERHHDVGSFYRHRVGRNLGATYAAHHLLDFRIFSLQKFLRLGAALYHLRERSALRHGHFYRKIALFQAWDKFATHELEGYGTHAEERNGAGNHILISRQDPFQNRSVPALQFIYHPIAEGFTHMSLLA